MGLGNKGALTGAHMLAIAATGAGAVLTDTAAPLVGENIYLSAEAHPIKRRSNGDPKQHQSGSRNPKEIEQLWVGFNENGSVVKIDVLSCKLNKTRHSPSDHPITTHVEKWTHEHDGKKPTFKEKWESIMEQDFVDQYGIGPGPEAWEKCVEKGGEMSFVTAHDTGIDIPSYLNPANGFSSSNYVTPYTLLENGDMLIPERSLPVITYPEQPTSRSRVQQSYCIPKYVGRNWNGDHAYRFDNPACLQGIPFK